VEQVTRLTNLTTRGLVHVDVRDGRILRMVPLDLDEGDGPSWTISARGREFTPPRRTTLSPFTVAHRSTIYSPSRILRQPAGPLTRHGRLQRPPDPSRFVTPTSTGMAPNSCLIQVEKWKEPRL
jgi:hypothetical protein